jgi:hypothetical protein
MRPRFVLLGSSIPIHPWSIWRKGIGVLQQSPKRLTVTQLKIHRCGIKRCGSTACQHQYFMVTRLAKKTKHWHPGGGQTCDEADCSIYVTFSSLLAGSLSSWLASIAKSQHAHCSAFMGQVTPSLRKTDSNLV